METQAIKTVGQYMNHDLTLIQVQSIINRFSDNEYIKIRLITLMLADVRKIGTPTPDRRNALSKMLVEKLNDLVKTISY